MSVGSDFEKIPGTQPGDLGLTVLTHTARVPARSNHGTPSITGTPEAGRPPIAGLLTYREKRGVFA